MPPCWRYARHNMPLQALLAGSAACYAAAVRLRLLLLLPYVMPAICRAALDATDFLPLCCLLPRVADIMP